MKKKVALLLALVMVLSLLPMNVFGNDPVRATITSTHHVDGTGYVGAQHGQTVVLAFPAGSFHGASTSPQAIAIELNLTGTVGVVGTAANAQARGLNQLTTANVNFVGTPPAGVTITVLGATPTSATLVLTSATGNFPATPGGFAISLGDVRINNANVQLGVRVAGVAGVQGQLMAPTYLAPAGGNITIHAGSVRDFAEDSVLFLDTIEIRENRIHNFTVDRLPNANSTVGINEIMIRLEAPAYYRWANTAASELDVTFRLSGATLPITSFYAPAYERIAGNDFNVMYFVVDTSSLAAPGPRILETIEIDGLALRPLREAPMGNVAIRVALVNRRLPQNPGAIYQQADLVTIRRAATGTGANARFFPLATITVGRRVDSTMSFVLQNAIPTVRTGTLFNAPAYPVRGVQTAQVELRENAPDAWGTSGGRRHVEFTFDQPGVTVIGATIRFGYNADRNNIFGDRHNRGLMLGTAAYGGTPGLVQWPTLTAGSGLAASEISITPNGVDVFLSDHRVEGQNLVLRATFFLSIEPGFEASNPGEDIYVTVGGRGLGALPLDNRTLAVARPADPVAVSVNNVTQIPTNPLGAVFNQPVGDIEIDVFAPQNLEVGQTFTVQIAGSGASAHLGLAFDIANISSDLPGLTFGQPVFSTPHGIHAGTTMTFAVTRRPLTNQGAATITISGVRVTGQLHPETEYNVILSGTAVAGNLATAATRSENANPSNPRDIGRFDATRQFYRAHILTYGGGIVADTTPPVTTQPPANNRTPIHLFEGMAPIAGVSPVFTLYGEGAYVVSMVALRPFGHLINGTATVNGKANGIYWGPVSAGSSDYAAQISGYDANGQLVTVIVWAGSEYARIVREGQAPQDVNIAAFVGGLSGSSVTPVFINDRIYLPVRFFGNVFGYDVTFANGITSLIPR